jgi:hypothetical protein
MSNTNTLASTKFKNNIRVVSGTYIVMDSDVVLLCDTSSAPVTIELAQIPPDFFSTQYKLYIVDNNNNATTNNILINAPTGFTINGFPSYTINQSGQSIQVFIASNTNYGIANAVNAPVTNQISDEPFGPSWDGITNIGASKNALYDEIIKIGQGFGNTAFVRVGGDNTTAQIGNILRPFGDIGTAIYGANGLVQAELANPSVQYALSIAQGSYAINDANCPQGIKPSGSRFNVFADVGAMITYSGTYGLWVNANTSTTGNIYGFLEVDCSVSIFTGTSDGVNGYLFNFGNINSRRIYQLQRVTVNGAGNAIRLGSSNGFGSEFNIQRLITSSGRPITCGSDCLFDVNFNIIQTDSIGISLDNSGASNFYSVRFYYNIIQNSSVANPSTLTTPLILIKQPNTPPINRIEFNNGNLSSNTTVAMVQFDGVCTNTIFKNCIMRSSGATSSSIYSFQNIGAGTAEPKLYNVIANVPLDASVTNRLSTGFTFDANL